MNALTGIDLRPGDIFFVDGQDALSNIIEFCQTKPGDPWARWCHTGVVLDAVGAILETTPWRTAIRSLPECYAGSRIKILRWPSMTDECVARGHLGVVGQIGRIYPYWRLLTHLVRLQTWLHGSAMDCTTLSASFLRAAGFPLKRPPWWYAPRALADEMQGAGCGIVFNGFLRAAGFIQEREM